MNKILIRGALMLFTLLPMLAFAQTPRYYWKFDNPGNPRVNHANTAATEDITNPVANHLIWTSGHRDNGPVGSYLQVGESTIPNPNPNNYVGYATISYNGGNFPTSWNPNGVTMEVLVRMDFPTYKLPILNFQERMFLWFNQGNITARIFEDNCNGQIGHTIVQPLTGYGRLDECYYLNGDWH
ncbi:MAG TPA: hypothetical protein ENJ82_13035, partial [Bacteroidetes bacterium]|nr:hypothetical protein [Bacteroidota bacterium]